MVKKLLTLWYQGHKGLCG